MKRFEEDRDVVTIYFDKLTSQKTCISFTVTRENVVDRLEPANVKLYDYYQQELMISSVSLYQSCFIVNVQNNIVIYMSTEFEVSSIRDKVYKVKTCT